MSKFSFKRVFLFTVILSMISLTGAVIIQFSWIYNFNKVLNQTLKEKVSLGINAFIQDYLISDLQIWDSDFSAINETSNTLKKNFDKSFEKFELNNLDYEFAIKGSGGFGTIKDFYLYKTPNFERYPTRNYYVYQISIEPKNKLEDLFLGKYVLITYVNKTQHGFYYSFIIVTIVAILFTIVLLLTLYLYLETIVSQRKINQLKTDFINNMTHELKTPIATISLSSDALHKSNIIANKDKVKEFAQIIKFENKRMLNIVERVLEFGRLEKREIILKKELLHMHQTIDTVLSFFNTIFESTNAVVTLEKKAKQDTVIGDPFHVQQALSNIIDNAVKYSIINKHLNLTITTENKNNYLIVKIKDNGIGISKNEIGKIFDKFYRTPRIGGNLHNVKGFGLGLSYVKYILDNMHAKIVCDSMVNKGTVFTLILPLA